MADLPFEYCSWYRQQWQTQQPVTGEPLLAVRGNLVPPPANCWIRTPGCPGTKPPVGGWRAVP